MLDHDGGRRKEAGGITKVYCNNSKCEYHKGGECTAAVMRYVDKLCRTFQRADVEAIMRPPFSPHCRKEHGKYRSHDARCFH